MQKIDLRNNLNAVIQSLRSNEIIQLLNQGSIEKASLLKLLIDSKAGYDQNSTDFQRKKVFDQFDANSIYSSDNYTGLLSFISNVSQPGGSSHPARPTYFTNNRIADFYSFHKTLTSTYNIISHLLFDSTDIYEDDKFDIQNNQNRGNLILQMIDDNKIDLNKFTEIVDSLKKLIDIIYLLYDKIENIQFEEHPKIEMVDSGSDINFVVKLPEKAANLLAQIFKQFWDLIINNKSYRYRQKLKDIEKSISVLEKITEAKDNGSIDPEMAEVLKKGIIDNTEKIVFRNTLTKQIVLESKEYSNRQILIEKTNTLLLENTHADSITD